MKVKLRRALGSQNAPPGHQHWLLRPPKEGVTLPTFGDAVGGKGTAACAASSAVWAPASTRQMGVNRLFPCVTHRLKPQETWKGAGRLGAAAGDQVTELLFIAQMTEEITLGGGTDGSCEARPPCAGSACCGKPDSSEETYPHSLHRPRGRG